MCSFSPDDKTAKAKLDKFKMWDNMFPISDCLGTEENKTIPTIFQHSEMRTQILVTQTQVFLLIWKAFHRTIKILIQRTQILHSKNRWRGTNTPITSKDTQISSYSEVWRKIFTIGSAQTYLRTSCSMTSSLFRERRVLKRLNDTMQSCNTHRN